MQFKLLSLATLLFFSGNLAAIAQEETFSDPIDTNTIDEIDVGNEDLEPYEFEFTIIDDILNQTIYAPFRQEGTVKESSRAAYVITQEQIEAQGYRTVNEALKYFPGVLTDSTAGNRLGAQSSQIIRGANSSSQTLILLDGRPINGFTNGSFDLSILTTDNVERIELIPGGASTLFGSNAIGGVINIVTRQPEFNQDVAFDAGVEIGNLGFNKQAIAMSYGQDNIATRIAYNRTVADNNYDYNIPSLNLSGTLENASANIQNINFQTIGKISDRHTVRLNSIYASSDVGVPGDVRNLDLNANQYNENWLLSLDLESRLGNSNNSTLNTRVFTDFDKLRFTDPDSLFSQESQYDGSSIGTQVQHNWQLNDKQNLTYGFDYRYTKAMAEDPGTFGFQYDDNLTQSAFFARYAVDVTPDVVANLGLRQDFNSLADGSFTSPSAGLSWQVGENTKFRANYARNFRAPTALDLYYPGASNPNLIPEIGNSFDVGIDQKFYDRALLRLSYFTNTLDDAIVFDLNTFTPQNLRKIRNQGLEAALTVQFTKSFSGFVNYTLTNSEILEDANASIIGNEVAFAGTDYLNLGLAYQNPQGLYIGVFLKNVGDRFTNNSNTSSLPSYANVDLRTRYPINENLNLTASWENIFDNDFQTFRGYPGVGSRFQVGLNAKF